MYKSPTRVCMYWYKGGYGSKLLLSHCTTLVPSLFTSAKATLLATCLNASIGEKTSPICHGMSWTATPEPNVKHRCHVVARLFEESRIDGSGRRNTSTPTSTNIIKLGKCSSSSSQDNGLTVGMQQWATYNITKMFVTHKGYTHTIAFISFEDNCFLAHIQSDQIQPPSIPKICNQHSANNFRTIIG